MEDVQPRMMPGSLRDWLLTFVLAVAREVDARTGSDYGAPMEAAVALHSPTVAMDWAISELRERVNALIRAVP